VSEEAAVAPSPAPPAPVLLARRRAVVERAAVDHVFAGEVAEFLADGAWDLEGDEAVGRLGPRWCRVSRAEVSIGHDAWAGSKRIPL